MRFKKKNALYISEPRIELPQRCMGIEDQFPISSISALRKGTKSFVSTGGVIMMGGGVPAPSGWTDDFATGSGNMSARTGWGTTYWDDNIPMGDRGPGWTYGSGTSNRVGDTGTTEFILADYAPTSADYYVEYKITLDADASREIVGPVIRASEGANGLTGYAIWYINTSSNVLDIVRYDNGVRTILLNDDPITDYDWTAGHIIKLSAVTNGGNVDLKFYIDGNLESSVTDSSAGKILTTGKGGLMSYWETGRTVTIDDFAIGY